MALLAKSARSLKSLLYCCSCRKPRALPITPVAKARMQRRPRSARKAVGRSPERRRRFRGLLVAREYLLADYRIEKCRRIEHLPSIYDSSIPRICLHPYGVLMRAGEASSRIHMHRAINLALARGRSDRERSAAAWLGRPRRVVLRTVRGTYTVRTPPSPFEPACDRTAERGAEPLIHPEQGFPAVRADGLAIAGRDLADTPGGQPCGHRTCRGKGGLSRARLRPQGRNWPEAAHRLGMWGSVPQYRVRQRTREDNPSRKIGTHA
jgi:hypothetical protein